MKCPDCHTVVPEGSKFCNECGKKLEIFCPECGKANPLVSKFCLECGHNLSPSQEPPAQRDLSFDEKLAKIQKYLPSGLTQKILSQKDRIEGERRHVTIMFVDMKGFTPLAESLGPEETFSLMDQVFEILIHKVHEYEGTVNELRGDGVLALFGAPIALEDAPQRAIRSALAMHREMTKFSETIKAQKGIPSIVLRVGINTGPVVVGTPGNDLRVQFTAVGDTINMAARMEQMAEPGTTYITEDTFRLTEGFFRFEALGEKQVKGKEKPLKVYRVIAPSTRRTRFDVSAERGLTRFLGRDRELELLIDSFERARSGRGQAVSLMGEAGVGKSRLLYEFRKAVANEDISFLEGKCLSYSRRVAYHPIIDILKSNFGIEDSDTDADIIEKVKIGLTLLEVNESSTLPYLLELLSVKDSGIDRMSMSPEAKKDRIIGALRTIILKGSETKPLIFAFEDLHWMDKSSEDAAKYLLESIPGARVLMIFTYRPEFVPTWGSKSFHSQLTLNRLSNRESLAVVAHILGSDNIASDLQQLILEKTEGVPFFIEELVRSLRDMEIIQRTNHEYLLAKDMDRLNIPSTIQDVIMARVDSLTDATKEVLRAGSVIEREFTYELIRAVTDLSEQELLHHISVLKDAELLYERGIFPQSTYVFRHAITREVVYDSILAKRKKMLHEKIGKAIEELCKDNISDHYGVLVEHFLAGENYEKAAQYAKLASKKAHKTASMNDAISFTEKGIACPEKLQSTEEVLIKIIDTRTILGLYMTQMQRHSESIRIIDPIVHAAEERNYKRRLSQIYTIRGTHESWVTKTSRARECLARSLGLANELWDVVTLVFANTMLATALAWNCDFEESLSHIRRVADLHTMGKNIWGVSVAKSYESVFHYYRGHAEMCRKTSIEAFELAEESGDIWSSSQAYSFVGLALYCKGFFHEAFGYLNKGADHCEKIVLPASGAKARWHLGEINLESGDYEEAKIQYRKALDLLEQNRLIPSFGNVLRTSMAKAKVLNHERDIDLECLYSYPKANRLKVCEGWLSRYLGEILLNVDSDHISEAQHWIEEAIEADRRNSMMFHLGRDHAVYADLFRRQGDRAAAKEQLGKAIDIYKECGADGWVKKAEEELAKMS